MNNAVLIGLLAAWMLAIGFVANQLGLNASGIAAPEVPEPGFFGVFDWIFDAAGTFFQIMTFQVEGIPVMANSLIFISTALGIGYIIIKLIRGGG